MRRMISLGLVLAAAMYFAPGCGGDSSSDNGGSGGGGSGGTDAGTGATGGSTGGAAGTSGTGGTGGTAACDPTACPGFQGLVPGCCLPDDTCGYDGTSYGYGCLSQDQVTQLLEGGIDVYIPPDAGDPNCDSYQIAGYDIVGCCAATGMCGVYNPTPWGPQGCLDWKDVPQLIPKPDGGGTKPCGADAGTDASDDGATEAGTDAATDASSD